MNKNKLKEDILKTILCLNSDISNMDRNRLINLLNSIIDYTNNTELEQKYNELVEAFNELKSKVNTYSDKINELKQKVNQLENNSQS